jgi:hypothetical protein
MSKEAVTVGTVGELTITLEEITPAEATEYLATTKWNRKPREHYITHLAGVLRRNEWSVNGETIIFDRNGNLIDGQHRLKACILANIPIWVLVVRGVDPEVAQLTIDVGVGRNPTDTLDRHGYKGSGLSTVLNMIAKLRAGKSVNNHQIKLTNQQIIAMLDAEPNIPDSIPVGLRIKRLTYGVPSVSSALHYLFSTYASEDADVFFRGVGDGNTGDVRDRLRDALIRDRVGRKKGQHADSRYHAALIIKAWNLWREGKTVSKLTFRTGGARPEEFPEWDRTVGQEIYGYDGDFD